MNSFIMNLLWVPDDLPQKWCAQSLLEYQSHEVTPLGNGMQELKIYYRIPEDRKLPDVA